MKIELKIPSAQISGSGMCTYVIREFLLEVFDHIPFNQTFVWMRIFLQSHL